MSRFVTSLIISLAFLSGCGSVYPYFEIVDEVQQIAGKVTDTKFEESPLHAYRIDGDGRAESLSFGEEVYFAVYPEAFEVDPKSPGESEHPEAESPSSILIEVVNEGSGSVKVRPIQVPKGFRVEGAATETISLGPKRKFEFRLTLDPSSSRPGENFGFLWIESYGLGFGFLGIAVAGMKLREEAPDEFLESCMDDVSAECLDASVGEPASHG